MYTYIKYNIKGKYVEFPEALNPELYNNIGETYSDYVSGKWVLLSDEQLAFREANPTASVKEVFEMKLKEAPVRTIEQAKTEMKSKINQYDSSKDVNVFFINGLPVWLDKATRAGLKLRFEAEASINVVETILWYNNMQFPLNVTNAIQMLYAIEIYASACYDNTQRHLAEIENLESIEDVDAYDYTAGYPEKLQF